MLILSSDSVRSSGVILSLYPLDITLVISYMLAVATAFTRLSTATAFKAMPPNPQIPMIPILFRSALSCNPIKSTAALKSSVLISGEATFLGSPPLSPVYEGGFDGEEKDAFPAITIELGDIIVGDEDGVVSVPVGLVKDVVELAKKGRAVDSKCMDDIRAGHGVRETFKKHRG